MKERIGYQWLIWLAGALLGLLFALLGKAITAEEVVLEPITVNAPMAMHEAFETTFSNLKLDKKYEPQGVDYSETYARYQKLDNLLNR